MTGFLIETSDSRIYAPKDMFKLIKKNSLFSTLQTALKLYLGKNTLSIFLFMLAGLFFSHNANAIVNLNEEDVLHYYQKQSLREKQLDLLRAQNEYLFELTRSRYNVTTNFDINRQLDQTDSPSTLVQQDNTQNKMSWLLGKRFLTGTTLGLELAHLENQNNTIPSTQKNSVHQQYFAVSLDQPLFPNFFGADERAIYEAAEIDYEVKNLQYNLDVESSDRDLAALFWKALVLKRQVEENEKMLNEYDRLAKNVRRKAANSFAVAGELEQALAEYEARKQTLNSDKVSLEQSLLELKIALNLVQNETIALSIKKAKPDPPKISTNNVESSRYYQLQKFRLQSAEKLANSGQYSNWPQLSAYGKYTQAGVDSNSAEAWNEMQDRDHKKYLIGLKLDYTFGQSQLAIDQRIRTLSAQIELEKSGRSLADLQDKKNLLETNLRTTYEAVLANARIIELRRRAVEQITRNYNQGRSDISLLIDAYNKRITAEVNYIRSLGDYQLLNLEYQSLVTP